MIIGAIMLYLLYHLLLFSKFSANRKAFNIRITEKNNTFIMLFYIKCNCLNFRGNAILLSDVSRVKELARVSAYQMVNCLNHKS